MKIFKRMLSKFRSFCEVLGDLWNDSMTLIKIVLWCHKKVRDKVWFKVVVSEKDGIL